MVDEVKGTNEPSIQENGTTVEPSTEELLGNVQILPPKQFDSYKELWPATSESRELKKYLKDFAKTVSYQEDIKNVIGTGSIIPDNYKQFVIVTLMDENGDQEDMKVIELNGNQSFSFNTQEMIGFFNYAIVKDDKVITSMSIKFPTLEAAYDFAD